MSEQLVSKARKRARVLFAHAQDTRSRGWDIDAEAVTFDAELLERLADRVESLTETLVAVGHYDPPGSEG